IPDPWTLENWTTVLGDEQFLRSLHNTLVLAVTTAIVTSVVHSLIAYIIAPTRYVGRRLLDSVSWLPFTVLAVVPGPALLSPVLGRCCSATMSPSASSKKRWWLPASSCSYRSPAPWSPVSSGFAAAMSAEESRMELESSEYRV